MPDTCFAVLVGMAPVSLETGRDSALISQFNCVWKSGSGGEQRLVLVVWHFKLQGQQLVSSPGQSHGDFKHSLFLAVEL